MDITICHLYYDLMNLYGEIGNIKAIKHSLEEQGVNVKIKNVSIDDKINFKNIDLIYMGSGTEDNRMLVLKHLLEYKSKIKGYIDDGKFFLITGNALGLFGNSVYDNEALGIFDFNVKRSPKRVVREVITNCSFIKKDIYGFMNIQDIFDYNFNMYLFKDEGVLYNNFYGTTLIGPLMVRNPLFLKHFIRKLILSKDKDFNFKKFDFNLENNAYKEYISFKKTKEHIKG